jgi:RHS repeat-associated protein
MAGISSNALKGTNYQENRKKVNSGTEFNASLDLNFYETNYRSLDPQLGRFWQIDALGDMSLNNSPYTFSSNNPVLINDPLGLADSLPGITLPEVVVNGHRNVQRSFNNFNNWFSGRDVGYNGSGWGHGPRRWLANQLGMNNTANSLFRLGLNSQLQSRRASLTGNLLNKIKTDPAMVVFQNKIIAALKNDPRFGKLSFILSNKSVVEFGGKRWSDASENWAALNNTNPLAHEETWDVAGNPLTWATRHATINYTATVKSDGTIVISYHLFDTLDLSAQGGRSGAYNTISSGLGFMYHDIVGGNSGMQVTADWQTTIQ